MKLSRYSQIKLSFLFTGRVGLAYSSCNSSGTMVHLRFRFVGLQSSSSLTSWVSALSSSLEQCMFLRLRASSFMFSIMSAVIRSLVLRLISLLFRSFICCKVSFGGMVGARLSKMVWRLGKVEGLQVKVSSRVRLIVGTRARG
jgi:hypothetical protein